HAGAEPPRVGGAVPRALDDVLARALAKRPEDRHATALELGAALGAAAAGHSAPPPLDSALAGRWIARAPEPLAEMVAALTAAPLSAARAAVSRRLAAPLARGRPLGGLAARGAAADEPGEVMLPERAGELGGALLAGGLGGAGWMELARALVTTARGGARDP